MTTFISSCGEPQPSKHARHRCKAINRPRQKNLSTAAKPPLHSLLPSHGSLGAHRLTGRRTVPGWVRSVRPQVGQSTTICRLERRTPETKVEGPVVDHAVPCLGDEPPSRGGMRRRAQSCFPGQNDPGRRPKLQDHRAGGRKIAQSFSRAILRPPVFHFSTIRPRETGRGGDGVRLDAGCDGEGCVLAPVCGG